MHQTRIIKLWQEADTRYQAFDSHTKEFISRNTVFNDLMACDGFAKIGTGMYSSVWSKDGRLYKINSNISGPIDGFYHWMKLCNEHPENPCLPKFGAMYQEGTRYCVELVQMEQTGDIQRSKDLVEIAKVNPYMMEAVQLAVKLAETNKQQIMTDDLTAKVVRFLDIHDENVMVRDGHYVLNDPISTITNFPIPVV